jgi:hypothetical protein
MCVLQCEEVLTVVLLKSRLPGYDTVECEWCLIYGRNMLAPLAPNNSITSQMSSIPSSTTTCDKLQSHNKLFSQHLYVDHSTLPTKEKKQKKRKGNLLDYSQDF